MQSRFSIHMPESIVVLFTLTVPSAIGQAPIGGIRGPVSTMVAPVRSGALAVPGYGGYFPYPNVILPYSTGYGYGGYDPLVAAAPSAAYFTYGNTSYTTESPAPLSVYAPRPPFASLPPPLPLTALLKVQVPHDAEIWLDGRKMRSTGLIRHYRTPPLDPTKEYAYEIRARWQFDNKPIEDVRHITIRAGATVLVDFTHLDPLVPRLSTPTPPPPAPANPSPG
jgi:uncharacterized protein (TIGR03000 family)